MTGLDSAKAFRLRWALSQSLRKQESYLDTLGDAVALAAEQVQDKRLDVLEHGPELEVADLFVDYLISTAFGLAGTLVKAGLEHLMTRLVRIRGAVATASAGIPVDLRLNAQRIETATRDIRFASLQLKFTSVTTKSDVPASLEQKLLTEYAKESAGFVLEKSKVSIKTKPSPPDKEAGGDTAGVALRGAILAFVRQQQAAARLTHDIIDLNLVEGLVDAKVGKALEALINKDKVNWTQNHNFQELATLSEQLKLFFEACIWASLFSARNWRESIELRLPIRGGSTWDVLSNVKKPELLWGYWINRFESYPTFPRIGSDKNRVIRFLRPLDSGVSVGAMQIIRDAS